MFVSRRGGSACAIAIAAIGALHGCSRAPSQSPTVDRPQPSPFEWRLPAGFPQPVVPPDNPMTTPKIELGRRLFHDTRLSGNRTFACASCHQQPHAFTDGRPQAIGSTGAAHARSSMTLTNVAYNASFGWADPSLRSLEAQMAVPMFNQHPIELGLKGREQEAVARFSSAEDAADFRAAFPGDAVPITLPNIVKAIAAFERTLISGDSPLDRYLYQDDKSALTPDARKGLTLFFSNRLHCAECHGSFNLSGPLNFEGAEKVELAFHNTGLYNVDGKGAYPLSDRGLFDLSGVQSDMGRFRAPTLRNIAVTAPYMHDGSVASLEAAIDHYSSGGLASPFRSARVRGFALTSAERTVLVAFLESLTDRAFLTNPAFAAPAPRP
jgi:cytochrome c peroxidase